ncbi:MAG: hypothetical protein JOZ73_10580, partial [Solirubrobacterales bacterium]|nr:hypothetical protein [Solirubrobacterales bacterium]
MLEEAGFVEVLIDSVEPTRSYESLDAFLSSTLDLARPFAQVYGALEVDQQHAVKQRVESLVQPYVHQDGSLDLPARSFVAVASA